MFTLTLVKMLSYRTVESKQFQRLSRMTTPHSEIAQLKSLLTQEKSRADQLSVNCMWLIEQVDSIHYSLCPDVTGSWQDRATQCVDAAMKLRKS